MEKTAKKKFLVDGKILQQVEQNQENNDSSSGYKLGKVVKRLKFGLIL